MRIPGTGSAGEGRGRPSRSTSSHAPATRRSDLPAGTYVEQDLPSLARTNARVRAMPSTRADPRRRVLPQDRREQVCCFTLAVLRPAPGGATSGRPDHGDVVGRETRAGASSCEGSGEAWRARASVRRMPRMLSSMMSPADHDRDVRDVADEPPEPVDEVHDCRGRSRVAEEAVVEVAERTPSRSPNAKSSRASRTAGRSHDDDGHPDRDERQGHVIPVPNERCPGVEHERGGSPRRAAVATAPARVRQGPHLGRLVWRARARRQRAQSASRREARGAARGAGPRRRGQVVMSSGPAARDPRAACTRRTGSRAGRP